MKTIKNSKDITTLEVGDKVIFGDLEYKVMQSITRKGYYLYLVGEYTTNEVIFNRLNLDKRNFIKSIGIDVYIETDFPETKSLEALTAIVSALFKEYEKQNELPKTWEEFCKRNPITPDEYWIETIYSRYCNSAHGRERDIYIDKNICISLQEAKAHTALMQLRQLRKCYIGNWEPNWTDLMVTKYSIICIGDALSISDSVTVHHLMSFPNSKLAKQFLTNFKDLLEIAKPLL